MTYKKYICSYWYHQKEPNFPPPSSASIEDGIVDGRLCLSIADDSLTPYQEKKQKKEWVHQIQGNKAIQTLWLPFKVNQELFDAVCTLPNLEGLWIKWSGIKSIEEIAGLTRLKYFSLGSSSQLESIRPLKTMTQLIWLELENLKKITDFSVVSQLTNLEGLGIEGSMWTTQRVDTLKPLQSLTNLHYLNLANTRAKDPSLSYLCGLKKLITFRRALWWPEDEVYRLEVALPDLEKN